MKQVVFTRLVLIFFVTSIVLISGYLNAGDIGSSAKNSTVAKEIEKNLADNFGMSGYETSWYRNIIGVSVRGNIVEVRTNLSSKNEKADNICGAVSGFVFSNENRSYGLNNVKVLGENGQILINRRGVNERCL